MNFLLQNFENVQNCLHILFQHKNDRAKQFEFLKCFSMEIQDFSKSIFKRGLGFSSSFFPKKKLCSSRIHWGLPQQNSDLDFLIVDKRVFQLHRVFFKSWNESQIFLLEATESEKNLETVRKILSQIIQKKTCQRIQAVGGGLTLDVGGFVAALLQFSVSYIPTTILACVDATFGGKTGVNFFPYGKNQVGLFYAPTDIFVYPEFFLTLSARDRCSGVMEAVKHFYLVGQFEKWESICEFVISGTATNVEMSQFLSANLKIKEYFVVQDPWEQKGLRTFLNFGHTIGHLLEALSEQGYFSAIPHGIAVGYGMLFVIEKYQLNAPECFLSFLKKHLEKYPLIQRKCVPRDFMVALLSQDKKNEMKTSTGTCFLILPEYGTFWAAAEGATDHFFESNKFL